MRADVTQAEYATGVTFPDSTPSDTGDTRPLPGDAPGSRADGESRREDQWGNVMLSGSEDGPHIIRSLWDGRTIRVCGEYRTGRHNAWWCFDEAEMRPVCSKCYPMAQGRR